MKVPPNPAIGHPDSDVRRAFLSLYAALAGGKKFGDDFVLRTHSANGKKYLLLRARDRHGKWGTVMAVSSDNELLVGSVQTNVVFSSINLEPPES